jgi:putative DNA-invertase from lambdoid prophage Rac
MAQRCGLWVRVSKDDQDTGNQLGQLRQLAGRRGMTVVAEYNLDGASAWTGAHRDQLRQALDDARSGKFDVMLVWALDRMSREGVEATLALLRRFREDGVMVWSLNEPWTETSDPRMAELLSSLFAWMAAEESRRRSERVRAGLERRRREGKPIGRQPGAADRKPRKHSGYMTRWERERSA